MPERPVDFRGALTVDLPRGRIETRDQQRLMALPIEAFDAVLTRASSDAGTSLGRSVAPTLEPDARAALDGVEDPSPEQIAFAVSAALALRGLGTVHIERWGDALALAWREAPGEGSAWDEFAAAIAEGLLEKLTGVSLHAAPVGRNAGALRLLLGSSEVCSMARERARDGASIAEIVARLESSEGERT